MKIHTCMYINIYDASKSIICILVSLYHSNVNIWYVFSWCVFCAKLQVQNTLSWPHKFLSSPIWASYQKPLFEKKGTWHPLIIETSKNQTLTTKSRVSVCFFTMSHSCSHNQKPMVQWFHETMFQPNPSVSVAYVSFWEGISSVTWWDGGIKSR